MTIDVDGEYPCQKCGALVSSENAIGSPTQGEPYFCEPCYEDLMSEEAP